MFWNIFKRNVDAEFKRKFLATKSIRIDGVPFVIKKINVLDYLEGGKVMAESFSIYKSKKDSMAFDEKDMAGFNRMKKYLTDVICAGVVEPKFTRNDKGENGEVPIKDLFTDWILAQKLAQEIFDFTHGKKK